MDLKDQSVQVLEGANYQEIEVSEHFCRFIAPNRILVSDKYFSILSLNFKFSLILFITCSNISYLSFSYYTPFDGWKVIMDFKAFGTQKGII